MDSFEEWAKTAQYPCFQQWGEQAVELGASWDSFNRDDKDAIVEDLVAGGIPILAARDMTDIAAAEVKKSHAPMAVFWDLENMPIPAETSGRDITSSLKAILLPHGDLIQFRGYASIGLNQIPQEKRSDLQLSGCHLVDCPHHGRKEVADKMIIVDAMQFAFQHQEGATLCFITGDVDYAYLLATLQRPQWRTIVISRGTMQSMLHVNCDMKMRWETDILQPIYGARVRRPDDYVIEDDSTNGSMGVPSNPFMPLSADEEWSDDVELLRTVIKQQSQKWGSLAPRKSLIGNILRATNPARFPQRISVQAFLAKAIEKGIVVENGDGAFKTLCLAAHSRRPSIVPTLPLSPKLPLSWNEIPLKTVEKAKLAPFVVFLRKTFCPSGSSPPAKAIVQSTNDWLFYLFAKHSHASNAALDQSWLRFGTFVDLRQIQSPGLTDPSPFSSAALASNAKSPMVKCPVCEAMVPNHQLVQNHGGSDFVCSNDCKEWPEQSMAQQSVGVELVVETLEFLASYDDLYVPVSILGKLTSVRHLNECRSRKLAKLWIIEAERRNAVKVYKHLGTKQKFAALPDRFDVSASQFLVGEQDTRREEEFVFNLLFDEPSGLMDRRKVNGLLSEKFGLSSARSRGQVFLNGKEKQTFFVAKGSHQQIVGLRVEQAEAALKLKSSVFDNGCEDRDITVETSQSMDAGSHNDVRVNSSEGSSDEEDLEAFIRR